MSSMLGCPSVSSEIGKIILSLDPKEDRYNILLSLDYFFLSSGKNKNIIDFVGINSLKTKKNGINGNKHPWGVANTNFDHLESCFTSLLDIDIDLDEEENGEKEENEAMEINHDSNNDNDNNDDNNNNENRNDNNNKNNNNKNRIKLCYLPNWWYSLSLASYIQEKENNDSSPKTTSISTSLSTLNRTTNETSGKNGKNSNEKEENNECNVEVEVEVEVEMPTAEEIFHKTLSIWPFLLQPLLKKAGVQTASSHWREIFAHPFFATAESR